MFKVASWNLNSVRSRLTQVTTWLKAREPDVLLLQELKGTEFPSEAFESLGYESVAVTQKAYNGVAILSRHPMETTAKALVGGRFRQPCAVLGSNHQGHPHRQYLSSQWQSGRE